ncbi:galactofuranosyltransferase [Bifidobacterium dolichotidis]|uniref:Galactofuranosyltransferase n=1 Tax=Bifidobacterium dolichotidis TaxID=2306976 RepID=A0A430FKT5_9BIFI|nr:glycosyltransferase [Bifidobacterium dolichotidis]RSX53351.1 galactofuranosyltransferase [Bifidobacterium dolichotidis]
MPSMKFANVLLETNPRSVSYPSLYVKADQPVTPAETEGTWVLFDKGLYDFTTYFNSLSVMKLRHYTSATAFKLHLELKGAACMVQQTMGDTFAAKPIPMTDTARHLEASEEWQTIDLPLTINDDMVLVGFQIAAEGRMELRNSYYELELAEEPTDVELVLSTTTFKKESFIERNIDLVRTHIVESNDDIAKHFHMYVMDNGRTLDVEALSSDRITVVPNDNVGGAGGFTRGMITAMEQKPKATHILLMDDDVAVSPESIKRTYNLLRILKPEHRSAMISGAMLNYEIGEDQWEDTGFMTKEGTFAPCKPGLRLTKFEDIIFNELFRVPSFMQEQRYAAWWYCCIPISVIEKNGLPLPFFVRCDDAEFGWRCNTEFITMNSLCVWHMSFHERYNAAVERYQTTRNTMIAQATTGFAPESDFMSELHRNVRLELKKFGYDNAELCLDAFEDFLKGPRFIMAMGQAEKSFMAANKNKEQLVSFEELQKQAAEDPELAGFDLEQIDRQLIDGDKPRSLSQRVNDYLTDNGQRFMKTRGEGYAVIPLLGWVYPAGAIRGKNKLVVIDWYNRKGAIRTKDVQRYEAIMKRYQRDLKYYKHNIERLRAEYRDARAELTSVEYWKHYLKMN